MVAKPSKIADPDVRRLQETLIRHYNHSCCPGPADVVLVLQVLTLILQPAALTSVTKRKLLDAGRRWPCTQLPRLDQRRPSGS